MHLHLHCRALLVNARVVRLDFERLGVILNGFLKLLVLCKGVSAPLIDGGEVGRVFVVERARFTEQLYSFVVVLILRGLRAFSRKLVRFFVALCLGNLRAAKRQSNYQSKSRIFFHDFQLDVNRP